MRTLQPIPAAPQRAPASSPSRRLLTVAIWTLSLGTLLVGGLIASLFVMMPVSLDIGEMVAAGADPWRDAAYAAGAYCLLFAASAAALVLWHRSSRAGRAAGRLAGQLAWVITAAQVALVFWGGATVMRDWF